MNTETMVLPISKSLKERGSQDSLSIGSGTMMRKTNNANSVASGPSCLNLSALTLNDNATHQSATHLNAYNHEGHQTTLSRGWGSAETRSASTSLSTMVGHTQEYLSQQQVPAVRPVVDTRIVSEKDGWGFFVDVVGDEEDEDALMW